MKVKRNIKKRHGKEKEEMNMATIQKPCNKITLIPADKSQKFIKEFNRNKPSQSFFDSCKKAGELFKRG